MACVGHLFSVSPISSPVAYSQSIKLNLMSKLPSPLQKSRCILSCRKSFHQKNRQAAHKWTYFRQKKNRPIPRTWTSACLLPVCSDRFLPPPKLSGGLPAAMVLLPRTEDGDAAQATKLLLLYTKDNNRNSRRP